MEKNLRKKILDANLDEHKKEAKYYDLLHLELYNKYEQKRLKNGIKNILKEIKSNEIHVLDVGSGTGNLVSLLLSLNLNKKINIIAVDISKEMQAEMRKKIENKNIKYQTKDIDSFLKENKQKFDLVMISSVLHHLPDYVYTLNTLVKHLKRKGVIYATHEPLNYSERSKSFIYKILNFIDKNMYSARFVTLRVFNKIPNLNIDYSDADYHTKDGGLSPGFIKKEVKCSKMKVNKYSVNYYTAGLSASMNYYNCFELIIYA